MTIGIGVAMREVPFPEFRRECSKMLERVRKI